MKNKISSCPYCGCNALFIDNPNPDSDGMDVMTTYDGNDIEYFEGPVVLVRCKDNKKHSFFASEKDAKHLI
jgi:hypothetical protein